MDGNTMRELDNGGWAEIVPAHCPCRGGWLLSDFDTWHRCPLHGLGLPHPEAEVEDFDYAAHNIYIHRVAWRSLASRAGLDLCCFRAVIAAEVRRTGACPETPEEWIEVASEVAEATWRDAAEAQARAQGFSCHLEAAWAEDARDEREGRDLSSHWY